MILIDKKKVYNIVCYGVPKKGDLFLGLTGEVRRARRDFDFKPGIKYFFILKRIG